MSQRQTSYSLTVRLCHTAAIVLLVLCGLTGLRLAWFAGGFSPEVAHLVDFLTPATTTYHMHLVLGFAFLAAGVLYIVYIMLTGEAVRLLGLFRDRQYTFTKKLMYLLSIILSLVLMLTGVSMYSGLYLGAPGYRFNSFLHDWAFRLLVLFTLGHIIEVFISSRTKVNSIFLEKPDNLRIRPTALVVAVMAAALSFWGLSTYTPAPYTLPCRELNRIALVDGREHDIEWVGADSVLVQTMGGANLEGGVASVTIKAFHTFQDIYILVKWDDPTPSFNRYLVKTPTGWQEQVSEYPDLFGETIYSEDGLGLYWGRSSDGCAGTCHVRAEDKMGLHYTAGDTADVWQWLAVSTNPALEADDRWWGPYDDSLSGGRHFDNKARGGYRTNLNEEWQQPYFLPTHLSQRYWIWFGSSGYEPYGTELDTYSVGDKVPAVLVAPTSGDRGDVIARGRWRNGQWTVEFSRKLSTGSYQDVPFRNEVYLGVAVFDNADSKHTYHLRPIKLVME